MKQKDKTPVIANLEKPSIAFTIPTKHSVIVAIERVVTLHKVNNDEAVNIKVLPLLPPSPQKKTSSIRIGKLSYKPRNK